MIDHAVPPLWEPVGNEHATARHSSCGMLLRRRRSERTLPVHGSRDSSPRLRCCCESKQLQPLLATPQGFADPTGFCRLHVAKNLCNRLIEISESIPALQSCKTWTCHQHTLHRAGCPTMRYTVCVPSACNKHNGSLSIVGSTTDDALQGSRFICSRSFREHAPQ